MTHTTSSITINRPPEEVFAAMEDSEQLTRWVGGLVSITPLTEGQNRVGARSKHVYHERGREIEMIEEAVAYEPNRRVAIKGETDMFRLQAEYRLTPVEGGTRVEQESTVRFNNWLLRLLAPLMRGASQAQMASDLERLKQLVETGRIEGEG